jgi:hypothetical protein
MLKRIIYSISILLAIALIAGLIISYARGYRFNLEKRTLSSTGILSVNSYPDGAFVSIDGKLKTATNATVSLSPSWYKLRITKEGYQSWEKEIRIQGEVVTKIDALLIPNTPSLKALTTNGVAFPTLSPKGSKVVYIVNEVEEATGSGLTKPKTGVYILELRNTALGGRIEPRQILPTSKKFTNAAFNWSQDEKQVILFSYQKLGKKETVKEAYQISTEDIATPIDVSLSWKRIIDEWENEKTLQKERLFENLSPQVTKLMKNSSSDITFSPDETKILYVATASSVLEKIIDPPLIGSNSTPEKRNIEKDKYYIYDLKEDKNFLLSDKISLPEMGMLKWYTDSKHILTIEKQTIYIIDYDGTNKRTVYAGPFEDNIVFPWNSPGKIVILTNFHKPDATPNLYEIDLR